MDKTLEKIYDAALKFLVPMSLEQTYETIVKEAMTLVNASNGSILLEENGDMHRVYATDPTMYNFTPRPKGYAYKVFTSNTPRIVPVKQIAKVHPEMTKATGSHFDIFVPLSYRNQTIGVLTVLSKENVAFTKSDLNVLRLFGPLATLAIIKTQHYEEANRAIKVRDLLISMASHELKTPVTTITLYTQLLQRTLLQGMMPDRRWLDTLSAEVERLTNLINELLHIDHANNGPFNFYFKNCSLREIVDRAIRDFAIIHPNYQIVLEDKINGHGDIAKVDFDKILQVLFNLLNNAAKFSQPNKPITIQLASQSSKISLFVKDLGKGISKEDLPYIFDRFYRGAHHTHEGMGLGLYLTKQIIDAHHGRIFVNSHIGRGTSVEIDLPRGD